MSHYGVARSVLYLYHLVSKGLGCFAFTGSIGNGTAGCAKGS